MKKWLRAQPQQPTTLDQLQTMLGAFVQLYSCGPTLDPSRSYQPTGRRPGPRLES
jgi:hypothetical protein